MARNRNRNPYLWFLYGLIFNFAAAIIIGGIEPTKEKRDRENTGNEPIFIEKEVHLDKLTLSLISLAVLIFIWVAITGFFNLMGLVFAAETMSEYLVVGWNFLVCAAYIIMGIGILRLESWWYSWVLFSTILNLLLSLYRLNVENPYSIVILPLSLIILGLTIYNRRVFK